MQRLLAQCGASLELGRRKPGGENLASIRALLRTAPQSRLSRDQLRAVRVLAARAVIFVVTGTAAARLNGAPIEVEGVDVLVRQDDLNRRRLDQAPGVPWVPAHIRPHLGWDEEVWRVAWPLDAVQKRLRQYEIRIMEIDDLIRAATAEEAPLLEAVRDELDRR